MSKKIFLSHFIFFLQSRHILLIFAWYNKDKWVTGEGDAVMKVELVGPGQGGGASLFTGGMKLVGPGGGGGGGSAFFLGGLMQFANAVLSAPLLQPPGHQESDFSSKRSVTPAGHSDPQSNPEGPVDRTLKFLSLPPQSKEHLLPSQPVHVDPIALPPPETPVQAGPVATLSPLPTDVYARIFKVLAQLDPPKTSDKPLPVQPHQGGEDKNKWGAVAGDQRYKVHQQFYRLFVNVLEINFAAAVVPHEVKHPGEPVLMEFQTHLPAGSNSSAPLHPDAPAATTAKTPLDEMNSPETKLKDFPGLRLEQPHLSHYIEKFAANLFSSNVPEMGELGRSVHLQSAASQPATRSAFSSEWTAVKPWSQDLPGFAPSLIPEGKKLPGFPAVVQTPSGTGLPAGVPGYVGMLFGSFFNRDPYNPKKNTLKNAFSWRRFSRIRNSFAGLKKFAPVLLSGAFLVLLLGGFLSLSVETRWEGLFVCGCSFFLGFTGLAVSSPIPES